MATQEQIRIVISLLSENAQKNIDKARGWEADTRYPNFSARQVGYFYGKAFSELEAIKDLQGRQG